MKRVLRLLLCAAMLLSLLLAAGCGDESSSESGSRRNSREKRTESRETDDEKDEFSKKTENVYLLTREEYRDANGGLSYYFLWEYDEENRPLTVQQSLPGGEQGCRYTYVYDGMGRVINRYCYSETDELLDYDNVEWTGEREVIVRHYLSNGSLEYMNKKEFDENNNLIKLTDFEGQSEYAYVVCTYNEDNVRMSSTGYYSEDGTMYYKVTMELDANGFPMKDTAITADGDVMDYTDYTCDEDGNILSEVCYEPDGTNNWSYNYTYDENGNVVSKKGFNEDGEFLFWKSDYTCVEVPADKAKPEFPQTTDIF